MTIDPAFDIRGITALLVEDSWIVGASTQVALESLGVVISNPVATVAEARALLEKVKFDVAIVDLNLQDARADDLIDDLHQRGIPFVVVSGQETEDHIARRALAVFTKPLRFNALLAVLRTVAKNVTA